MNNLKKAAVTLLQYANDNRDGERKFAIPCGKVAMLTGVSLSNFQTRFNLMWEIMELDRVNDVEVGPREIEIEFAD